ncbi:stage II sporulation protein P [Brevibacillus sp. GCM10020057]|uniref:stage II sporulation protein P n=1 Tax=Brevibacillus sp. GCM10020057 TaxID=3317327 RepID=UPI00362BB995
MRMRIRTGLLAVCLLTPFLMPPPFAQAATHVEVAVDQLNVRSGPDATTQIVGMIAKSMRLPIVQEQKDWTQVKLANGTAGWINNKYVKKLDIPQIKYVKSNVGMLNVRAEPNATAQILQIIDQNGVFLQLKKQGDWAQIKLSDKASGWVNARYLSETSAPAPKPAATPVPTPSSSVPTTPAATPASTSAIPTSSTPTPTPVPAAPEWPNGSFDGHSAGTIVLTEGHEVYTAPDFLATVIGQLDAGTTVSYYGYADGWYSIYYNGTYSYLYNPVAQENAMQGNFAIENVQQDSSEQNNSTIDSAAPPQPDVSPETATLDTASPAASIRVKNADTNLRSGPGTTYPVVGIVQPGQVFPIVQEEGDWYLIRRPDNTTAYIAGWIVEKIAPVGSAGSTGSTGGLSPNGSGTAPIGYNQGMVGNESVYIYHTHNRESWRNVARNTQGSSVDDPEINITLVGKRLGELLNGKGIAAMVNQDDFAQKLAEQKKSYAMSYTESYKAVMAAASASPNLKYIFDIHRDSDEPRSKVAITLNGKTYSRILFVIGTANPTYQENKKLAEILHARLEAAYPGLSRGVILKGTNEGNGVYNQSVSQGSLLLEFGGTNNTLEECYNTAEAFADVFVNYMLESQVALK